MCKGLDHSCQTNPDQSLFSSYGSKLHKLVTELTGNSSTFLFWKFSRNSAMTQLISSVRQMCLQVVSIPCITG